MKKPTRKKVAAKRLGHAAKSKAVPLRMSVAEFDLMCDELRSAWEEAPKQLASEEVAANARIYPCADCGKLRSKDEGGTTFTVCDSCWDKHYHTPIRNLDKEEG